MIQIKAKVYYLISTGEVLVVTSEMQCSMEARTKEQDLETYNELKDKNINDIDYIELEFGTFNNTFNKAKSYSINLETKQLEVIYYTQEELNTMQQQNQQAQELNARVSDISQYLNSNTITISDVENIILQSEQNKVNGGM